MNNKKILVTRSTLPPLEEYVEMLKPIWESAWLTNMGEHHHRLEEELQKFLQIEEMILFTNGHLALEMLLQAMELTGEVITTPFTFVSTVHAITRNGLTPVFCDIDPIDFTLDPAKIEACITEKTSAILPVHVYGNICRHEEIERIARKHGLKLLYDAAHAFGEKLHGRGVAGLGDASMFSFHATKVFHTIEGGAVATKDPQLRRKLDYLKNFGISDKENVPLIGGNAKMNEFQAAMGLCNLRYIQEMMEKRKRITKRYLSHLADFSGIQCNHYQKEISYNYAYFPIVVEEEITGFTRDQLYDALVEENIYARKYFYPCINAMECYAGHFDPKKTPIAERISKRVLTLPIYPELELETVDKICKIIKNRGKKR